jgi:hypothetical protein
MLIFGHMNANTEPNLRIRTISPALRNLLEKQPVRGELPAQPDFQHAPDMLQEASHYQLSSYPMKVTREQLQLYMTPKAAAINTASDESALSKYKYNFAPSAQAAVSTKENQPESTSTPEAEQSSRPRLIQRTVAAFSIDAVLNPRRREAFKQAGKELKAEATQIVGESNLKERYLAIKNRIFPNNNTRDVDMLDLYDGFSDPTQPRTTIREKATTLRSKAATGTERAGSAAATIAAGINTLKGTDRKTALAAIKERMSAENAKSLATKAKDRSFSAAVASQNRLNAFTEKHPRARVIGGIVLLAAASTAVRYGFDLSGDQAQDIAAQATGPSEAHAAGLQSPIGESTNPFTLPDVTPDNTPETSAPDVVEAYEHKVEPSNNGITYMIGDMAKAEGLDFEPLELKALYDKGVAEGIISPENISNTFWMENGELGFMEQGKTAKINADTTKALLDLIKSR